MNLNEETEIVKKLLSIPLPEPSDRLFAGIRKELEGQACAPLTSEIISEDSPDHHIKVVCIVAAVLLSLLLLQGSIAPDNQILISAPSFRSEKTLSETPSVWRLRLVVENPAQLDPILDQLSDSTSTLFLDNCSAMSLNKEYLP